MAVCPKCGFSQPPGPECPACGIIFAKFLAQSEPTEGAERSEEHSWEGAWFPDEEVERSSPVRLVTLLVLLAVVTLGAYLEYSRHTEAFQVAENSVCAQTEIRIDLGADRGDELRVGYFFRGQARVRGSGGNGRFLFRVHGPNGEGTALVHLLRRKGAWRAIQIDFQGPRGQVRSLEVEAKKKKKRPRQPRGTIEPEVPTAPTEEPPSDTQ